jgi:hypothetical protein
LIALALPRLTVDTRPIVWSDERLAWLSDTVTGTVDPAVTARSESTAATYPLCVTSMR